MDLEQNISRRELLQVALTAASTFLVLSACTEPSATPLPKPTAEPTATPKPKFSPESLIPPKDRLATFMHEPVDLPPAVRGAFEAVTNAYSASRRPDNKFQRLRQVAFSTTTTQQIIDRARAGNLFIEPCHPAIVVEFDQLRDFAASPKEHRAGILDVYAEAIVDGLTTVYNPREYLAIAIEAGHWSYSPKDKIEQINQDRKKRGVSRILRPTQDTGAFAKLLEGGDVSEKETNLALSRLIGLKVIQRFPKWIPVINTQENGFPVDRFNPTVSDNEDFYIRHRDALISLRYKWERLAEMLKGAGVPMARIAVHFDGTPNLIGGFIIPQNANYKEESLRLANSLATKLEERVKPHRPEYVNVPRLEYNPDPESPFWMIDDLAHKEDAPAVSRGEVDKVRGATNRLLAGIRSEALRSTGR